MKKIILVLAIVIGVINTSTAQNESMVKTYETIDIMRYNDKTKIYDMIKEGSVVSTTAFFVKLTLKVVIGDEPFMFYGVTTTENDEDYITFKGFDKRGEEMDGALGRTFLMISMEDEMFIFK